MRAFAIKEYAHPTRISLSTDVPEPNPRPDEVLVDVYSASLNYFDVSTLKFYYYFSVISPFTHRSCNLKGNTRSNHHFPSYWEPNSLGRYPRTLRSQRAAHTDQEIVYLVPPKVLMPTKLPRNGGHSSHYLIACPTIKVQVRGQQSPQNAH